MIFLPMSLLRTSCIYYQRYHPSPNPKRHLDQFSRYCRVRARQSLYYTVNSPFPPSELPSCTVHPKVHFYCFSHFAGLTTVINRPTDRQTDRPRYSICSNRPHLHGTATQPKNGALHTKVQKMLVFCWQYLVLLLHFCRIWHLRKHFRKTRRWSGSSIITGARSCGPKIQIR